MLLPEVSSILVSFLISVCAFQPSDIEIDTRTKACTRIAGKHKVRSFNAFFFWGGHLATGVIQLPTENSWTPKKPYRALTDNCAPGAERCPGATVPAPRDEMDDWLLSWAGFFGLLCLSNLHTHYEHVFVKKRSTWTVPGQHRVDFLWRIHIWHRHGWSQVSGSTRSMTQLLTVHIRHQIQKENERNNILIPWIQPSHVSFGRLRCPVQWTVFRRRLRGRRQCQGNVLDMWRTHGEQRTPQHTRTFWANTHESTFSWNGQVEANDPVYVTGHVIVRKWSTNESLRTDWKEPVTK